MAGMIRTAFAVAIGILIVVLAASTQSHFKADSLPDFVCDLVLLPGGLFAAIFRDRGNASPEFLWREWAFCALLYSLFIYWVSGRVKRFG
jgi:hypothetical protein